jgi:plastocyanin
MTPQWWRQSRGWTDRVRREAGGAVLATVVMVGIAPPGYAGDLVGRVTARGRPVREAVLFLEELRLPPVSARAKMDQKNRTFIPHVLAVQLGTRVEFPNSDTIYHNVFSTREGKPFDLGLYPVRETKVVQFRQPGLIRLFCNIHSNMSAFIWVVENPCFDVTDRSGRFRIPRVPGGARVVRVWHERLGSRTVPVTVPEDGEVTVNIQLESR